MTEPTRKHVSWRVGELKEHEKVNRWIDAQSNIQLSLASIVLHMVDRFGYRNITEHDIQKILYQEPLLTGLQSVPLAQHTAMNAIPEQPQPIVAIDTKIATNIPPLQESLEDAKPEEEEEDDPLLQQINPKSF
ncbi:hypothetical protein BS614_30820 (plasmid) [Paenibacillus xylanexedens]|uniref:hypothetical protein n=1 Tax=Paenibacillus xylanexedens TaxID=528191 RepID=UPI0009381AD0|nr:hypothetical protein [Paenibacillus xylanexedens]APO48517.1 hypothetical protein BS614_30820 [Paenibacillus xylanexedens]